MASKNYNTLVEFAKFLRENGDKLFEKDSKLCLKSEQILILQEYLQQINSKITSSSSASGQNDNTDSKYSKRKNSTFNPNHNREFLLLYKSNQLHLIQDFLFKITNLKISAETPLNTVKDYIRLSIFGSLTYLEIKNCPINNVYDLQNLRNQLEILICIKSTTKVQDLLHLCGADQSSPVSWPKLHTLNLSYNQLNSLDNSFRLSTSIEILDLSHNNLRDCSNYLHSLPKLKRLNLSFNKLESIPSLCITNNISTVEYLDLSYNNIDKIEIENTSKLAMAKELNLSNNLISDIIQINHLRLLSSLKTIKIEKNPICLNEECNNMINNILRIVYLNQNTIKKNSAQYNQPNLYRQNGSSSKLTRSTSIVIKSTPKVALNGSLINPVSSVPNTSSNLITSGSFKQDLNQKKKLKANVVLIEHDAEDDYYFVDKTELGQDTKKLSLSYGTSYDPQKLQQELENLKKMRQNYGTDWLLSAPSMNSREPNKKAENGSNEISITSSMDSSSITDKSNVYINEISSDQIDKLRIIESYAVYVTALSCLDDNKPINEKNLCILSITDKYLIEKDETNSNVISVCEFNDLNEIFTERGQSKEIKIQFKQNLTIIKKFEFENETELKSFIEYLRKILFNEINLNKCEILFCIWCDDFVKKSKFNLNDDYDSKDKVQESINSESSIDVNDTNNNSTTSVNLTCTNCNKYLIKKGEILDLNGESKINLFDLNAQIRKDSSPKNSSANQIEDDGNDIYKISSINIQDTSSIKQDEQHNSSFQSQSFSANFTLKEALNSMRPSSTLADTDTDEVNTELSTSMVSNQIIINETDSANLSTTPSIKLSESESTDLGDQIDLKSLLKNNQMTKSKLDEITNISKRINNNLKLYLIINILNENSSTNKKGKEKSNNDDEMLVSTFKVKSVYMETKNKSVSMASSPSPVNSLNNPFSHIEKCLCLLTNKNIIIFNITNEELFDENIDFEKCLCKEMNIEVNQIEIIEIALGQHYLVIQTSNQELFKFVTNDVYQTQALLNILLKIINESKTFTMLKQIKKKNETNSQNLAKILEEIEGENIDPITMPISLFCQIDDLRINDEINECGPFLVYELFLYDSERLLLIEENLDYFSEIENSENQFRLVDTAKISDIVHLRISKDNEKRIEISFVDESRNSKQIIWSFNLNKQHLLSQLINQLKLTWEKIFLVDLPINY